MQISCCIWALSEVGGDALDAAASAGFEWIDIRPGSLDTEKRRARAVDLELKVSCFGASFGLPEGSALDHAESQARSRAIAHVKRGVEDGSALGATTAYVIPETDPGRSALSRYAGALTESADRAIDSGLRFCVEHFPGRALPTAERTLEFLRGINHPNLFLLLDVGHIQISNEDPAAVIANAGPLLGYVHLNDNDGKGDQHLPLLDGILTIDILHRTFRALNDNGYTGSVSLELNPSLADPLEGLNRSRSLVESLAQ